MKFKITETNEIETLNLIDPKSGCCWLGDAMAGDDNIKSFERDDDYDGPEADVDCNQETFDWWETYTEAYQKADDKWHELLDSADSDKNERMLETYQGALDNDMESHPATLNALCDQFGSCMVIASDSCNGQEEEFEAWMNKNHPDIETRIENTLDGGLYDSDDCLVENENYWDQYGSSVD